jgi:alanyl-tRNA synthetase
MLSKAPAEPGVREFEADVERVDGRDVVLSETYFYAESGGQPADRGTLGGVPVAGVREEGGAVVHALERDPPFEAGETVAGAVDGDFRTYCMRAHTASHALYGAGRRLLDDLGYGGFDIDSEKVRVDLSTSTDIDDDVLLELERLTNRAVWDSRPVSWSEVSVEDARAREDVAFNTKTEEGAMADADAIRVVEIEGWDAAACGGTHVSDTAEIGPVEVLGRSNPGEGLTRVEFAVGPPALERRAAVHGAALGAARELGTSVEDVPDAVADLRAANEDLESRVADLTGDLLESELAAFDAVDVDGETWRVGAVDGFGPNEVGERAKALAGDGADVVAAAGEQGSTFLVVASRGETNAGDVVDRVTEEFGGGGGGGPPFAQGGGVDADPEEVVAFLRS